MHDGVIIFFYSCLAHYGKYSHPKGVFDACVFGINGCWCSFLFPALFLRLSSHLTDQRLLALMICIWLAWWEQEKNALSQVKWGATETSDGMKRILALFKGTCMIRGMIGKIMQACQMGTIGMICRHGRHDSNNLWA